MAYMRSTLAFSLFWINLIVASLNIYFSIAAYRNRDYPYQSYNLRGTKERLLQINPNYFLEKELETSKELRNLAISTRRLLLFIDIGAFVFLMLLTASFCLTKNECCSGDENTNTNFAIGSCYGTCVCCTDCDCNRSGSTDCNCSGGGGDCGEAGIILLVIVLVIIIFVAIYFLVRACGKHISRIIAIIFLFAINVALAVLAIYSGTDIFCILIAAFSAAAAVSDFLGILLPNLGCCVKLSYDYRYPIHPMNQQPQLYLVEPGDNQVVQPEIQPGVEPQFEKPFGEENYPQPQEIVQVPSDTTPINTDQSQENDNYGNAYDAPAPVYQEQNDNNNNNIQIDNQYPYPYPSQQ